MVIGLGRHAGPTPSIGIAALALLMSALLIGELVGAQPQDLRDDQGAACSILAEAPSKSPQSAALLNALASVEHDQGEYFEAERSGPLGLAKQ